MEHFLGPRLFPAGPSWASLWSVMAVLLITSIPAAEYQNHFELSARLKKLATERSHVVQVTPQVLTAGQHEVWLVELGSGPGVDRKQRPGMLVVAGIEGNDLVGTASAVNWIEQLTRSYQTDASIQELLDTTTIYCFPRVNPDAAEAFFLRPRVERTVNQTPVDDDHDGLLDEDGPEDLNADGLVTWMRVQHPEGEYIPDPAEPRLLIKADRAKGERGAWKLLLEGTDNDHDEHWNEDDRGGVNLNRNFPYGYQFFATNAGWHPVSEVESRALADFVVAHPNIGIVFTFGAADNLVQAPKAEPAGKRPPTVISEADAPYYQELGQTYRDMLGLKKELTATTARGSFSDWMYFHRGRLSLAAKPWTPTLQAALAQPGKKTGEDPDTFANQEEPAKAGEERSKKDDGVPAGDRESAEGKTAEKKPPSEKRNEDERLALKWFDKNAPESYLAWKEFRHPDFPNHRVEIGGWAPFARSNPPVALLSALFQSHGRFLTALANRLPRVGFRRVEAKPLGSRVFELTVQVENTGYLPLSLNQGTLTREVLRTRVLLNLAQNQILAGQKITLLGAIAGSGGMEELRYLIHATGPVEIEVISALGGRARQTVELEEAP